MLKKFYVNNVDGYKVFGLYDNYGYHYIVKTKGVMQYEVYLDDYTIEI